MTRFLMVAFFVCGFSRIVLAQWSNGQAADVVIGQANMTSNSVGTTANTLSTSGFVGGSVVYDSQNAKLYVIDTWNNRVLRFSYPGGGFSSNQPSAEAVLGQPDFTTGSTGTTSQKMKWPYGGTILDDTLWVADYGNNRVVGFYSASTKTTGAEADVVLGQSDFITNTPWTTAAGMYHPSGVAIDPVTRDLYVVEYFNHRVLKFLASNKSTGASATLVFGQANFTSGTGGTAANRFGTPSKVLFHNNNLFVVEYGNKRVVRFNNARSISSNQPTADVVFGQPDFSTVSSGTTSAKLGGPAGAVVDGAGRLYVSDQSNNRVLIFPDAFSASNGPTASYVIGQANFTSSTGATTSTSLGVPDDIGLDVPNKKLFVVDAGNNRVMQYTASSVLPVQMSSFTSAVRGSSNRLAWRTESEVNSYGFEIERRAVSMQQTMSSWQKVSFVAGSGTSNLPHEYSYVDRNLAPGRYAYRIKQIDADGSFKYSEEVEVETGVAPKKLMLGQNYPNPFNPATTIRYGLPDRSNAKIVITNTLGQEVAVLTNGEEETGYHEVGWHANVASGVYFYRIDAVSTADPNNRFVQVKKMVLLK